jgi:methionyl-tRNA synthetase
MLLAAGLPLPRTVFVHGYLTVDGQKIGKSLGNAGDPQDLIGRYGADALRWYLLRETLPAADSDFAEARLVARYNADLANDLGNLLNRTAAMLHRYRGGLVPPVENHRLYGGYLPAIADSLPDRLAGAMSAFDPRTALAHLSELVVAANRLVEESAPWALFRAECAGDAVASHRINGVLYALLEALRLVSLHLEPFLPRAATEMRSRLGLGATGTAPYEQRVRWGGLPVGARLAAPTPLFPRLPSLHEGAG